MKYYMVALLIALSITQSPIHATPKNSSSQTIGLLAILVLPTGAATLSQGEPTETRRVITSVGMGAAHGVAELLRQHGAGWGPHLLALGVNSLNLWLLSRGNE